MEINLQPWCGAPIGQPHVGASCVTFAEAAANYIEHGGGEAHYLRQITPRLGHKQLTEIFPFDVRQLARDL